MMKRTGWLAGFLIVAVAELGLAAAQQTAPSHGSGTLVETSSVTAYSAAQPSVPQLQTRDSRYQLCAGDSFDVSFELSPEFNQTVYGSTRRFRDLEECVGDVKVIDQTVPQLTQTLREGLRQNSERSF